MIQGWLTMPGRELAPVCTEVLSGPLALPPHVLRPFSTPGGQGSGENPQVYLASILS